MEAAVTYKDLSFSFADILHVDRIEIRERPNTHGSLRITAVLDADRERDIFFEVPDTLSLLYEDGGGKKILFSGMLFSSSMSRRGKYLYLTLEAKTHTYRMDLKKKIRSFQNTGETFSQIMGAAAESYPGLVRVEHFTDRPVDQLLSQYEETDWEFLKRLMGKCQARLYPQAFYETPAFQAGLAQAREPWRLREDFFISETSFGEYERIRANAQSGALPQQYLSWKVESWDILPLGCRLLYRGKDWFVGEIERRLTDGILRSVYTLVQKEREILEPAWAPLMPGVSLDGTIKSVARDKVQVLMDRDLNTRTAGQYWFPYSTVAGSSDGSGWYCMPENGEKIRVYFPTADEKEAYVISALSGNTLGNQGGSMDPAVKHISTAQGNTVTFCGSGANISVKGGTGTVNLGSDGAFTVTAAESISIYAGSKVSFCGNEITSTADEEMGLAADPGASISLKPGLADVKAVKIYQN